MTTKHWFDDALLINRDPNWYGYAVPHAESKEQVEDALRSFFCKFTEDALTDVQLCVFENTSIIPSDAVMWRGLKFLQTEENGIPVSYPQLESLYRMFHDFGVDPVQIFLDTLRAGGIRPWITLRMNDAHFGGDPTSFLRDDFFYTAEKNGWMIGEEYGYYAHCLDYGCESVRARMLAFIDELFAKYDMFGLELDFMREIHSFDYRHNADRVEIMNGFIAAVREKCIAAGEQYGHPVRLMVRVPREIDDALVFGFDVGYWAKNGLVDAIVPTPRWEVSDDGIPVAAWKALVGEDIAVFPGVEILMLRFSSMTADIARAYSAAWNTQGADGLYFNNHDYATPLHKQVYGLHRDTVLADKRRYIVTYQDIAASGNSCYRPLPLNVDGEAELSLCIGPVRDGDRLTVIADIDGTGLTLALDSHALGDGRSVDAVYGGEVDDSHPIALTEDGHTFAFDAPDFTTEGAVTLKLYGKGTLRYLEFDIE